MVHEHRAGGGREGVAVRRPPLCDDRRIWNDSPLVQTYGVVGASDFLAPLSSSGFLEISRRESNAASQLEVVPGMPVAVRKA